MTGHLTDKRLVGGGAEIRDSNVPVALAAMALLVRNKRPER